MASIVLFDGMCNLCNSSVRFIIQRDPEGKYQFASLQSDTGSELMKKYAIPETFDSFILIQDDKWYDRSSAALRVVRGLKGAWKLLYLFILVPKPVRDVLYRFVARNRYKWFGQRDSCMIPTPAYQERFLA